MKETIKQLESENKKTVKSYERNIKELNVKLKTKPGIESKTSSKILSKSKEKPKSKVTSTVKPTTNKLRMVDSPKSVKSTSKSKSKSKVRSGFNRSAQ